MTSYDICGRIMFNNLAAKGRITRCNTKIPSGASNRRYHLHKRREIINFADVNHLSKKFSIILSMALLIMDTAVNEQFDFLFNSILLIAVGICIASVVLFIQMMQKQKELEKFGYRKNTPTPVVWYIVYFIFLFSFIFSFVSLLMVIIQKKRIEHIKNYYMIIQNNSFIGMLWKL